MKPSDFRAVAIVALGLLALPATGYAAGTSSSSESAKPDLYKQAGDVARDSVTIEHEGFESSDYKRHLIGVMTAQALHQAAERAT